MKMVGVDDGSVESGFGSDGKRARAASIESGCRRSVLFVVWKVVPPTFKVTRSEAVIRYIVVG